MATDSRISFALGGKDAPVVVASSMRSGTHLTLDLLRKNFDGIGAAKFPLQANDNVYLPIDCLVDGTWSERRVRQVIRRSPALLCKTHWTDPEFDAIRRSRYGAVGEWLRERSKVILVHRHPERTMDSLVVWHLFTGQLREPKIPSDEWLLERLREWRSQIERWSGTSRPLLKVSAEQIVGSPRETVDLVARFLGRTPISRSRPLPAQLRGKWHSRMNRLFSTRPESTEILTLRPAPKIAWTPDNRALMRDAVGEFAKSLGYDV